MCACVCAVWFFVYTVDADQLPCGVCVCVSVYVIRVCVPFRSLLFFFSRSSCAQSPPPPSSSERLPSARHTPYVDVLIKDTAEVLSLTVAGVGCLRDTPLCYRYQIRYWRHRHHKCIQYTDDGVPPVVATVLVGWQAAQWPSGGGGRGRGRDTQCDYSESLWSGTRRLLLLAALVVVVVVVRTASGQHRR